LALRTLLSIAQSIYSKYGLLGVSITHRLGEVGIGEESILIAVSSAHRTEGWRAGEECLETVKQRAEVWKEEWLVERDGTVGAWRSNRDGVQGVRVDGEGKGTQGT
jgi:molybdopterin synthase catalytic subunit